MGRKISRVPAVIEDETIIHTREEEKNSS